MPRHKKSQLDSLERKVIETPSLSRLDVGIFNEGFNSIPHLASPSFFYIDDNSSWMDNRRTENKRFTESWIELDRAYSCGSSTSYDKKCFSSSSTSSSSACCSRCCCHSFFCCSCSTFIRILVYLLIAITVIGFAAIISAILYMEIFHKFDEPYFKWTNETLKHETRAKSFNLTLSTASTMKTNSLSSDPLQDGLNVSLSDINAETDTGRATVTSPIPTLITVSMSGLSSFSGIDGNPSSETPFFTTSSVTASPPTTPIVTPFTIVSNVTEKKNNSAGEASTSSIPASRLPLEISTTRKMAGRTATLPITTVKMTTSESTTKLTRDWSQRTSPSTTSSTAISTTIPPI